MSIGRVNLSRPIPAAERVFLAFTVLSCEGDREKKNVWGDQAAMAGIVNRLRNLSSSFFYVHLSWLNEWIKPAVNRDYCREGAMAETG
jgi:hypothetical protein